MRAGHVGRDKKPFILGEDLGRPLFAESERSIYEAVCNCGAAGQKERPTFVLAVARFKACAGGEPVTCTAFDGAGVATDSVSNQKTLVCISIQILTIDEEMASAVIMRKTLGTYCFDAKIHVLQEG